MSRLLFIIFLLAQGKSHGTSLERFAQQLVELRGEVEELGRELTRGREDFARESSALSARRAQLELQWQQESLRRKKMRGNGDALKKKLAESVGSGVELASSFQSAAAGLRKYVAGSLPFQREKRLAAVAELEKKVARGLLAPPMALGRLGNLLEDEERLTRENVLFRQSIQVDGEEKLASVAKLGMVLLYYRTADGGAGLAEKVKGAWSFRPAASEDERDLILTLFDGLKKQVRVGNYRLPVGGVR